MNNVNCVAYTDQGDAFLIQRAVEARSEDNIPTNSIEASFNHPSSALEADPSKNTSDPSKNYPQIIRSAYRSEIVLRVEQFCEVRRSSHLVTMQSRLTAR
ncbi:MAG: hypothetical protein KF807_00235 [Xanthobacteraceae bacterium]|nr:hypothetical protein [Xanthobacteraceae bacterium]